MQDKRIEQFFMSEKPLSYQVDEIIGRDKLLEFRVRKITIINRFAIL
ncbi:MAG: hypothetical protein GX850_01660 [Clostridiaceae bacterium]|nr:hypothetical protein [Clostridiaceae bacterium]